MERKAKSSATRLHNNDRAGKVKEDIYTEEFNIIHSMWDDLGVTDVFRNLYESIIRELDDNHRKEFIDFEIGTLKRFLDNLNVISLLRFRNYQKRL